MEWSVVYKRATLNGKRIVDPDVTDADLYFPKKLTIDFLKSAQRSQGSYMYANQYDNLVMPDDKRTFKKDWFRYYQSIPDKKTTFMFVDPALSEQDHHDYTGIIIVHVGEDVHRYLRYAQRHRVTPTELVDLIFRLYEEFKPNIIGIESVAFQKALIYFLNDEMKRRNIILPIQPVNPPTDKNKETKILGLVPYFEFGHISIAQGLDAFEDELLTFPRGSHDDLIDALASIQEIIYPPAKERPKDVRPSPANAQKYEEWYRQSISGGNRPDRRRPEEQYGDGND